MAKLNLVFALAGMLSVVLSALILQITAAAAEATAESSTDFAMPPEPYPGFYSYADGCLEKLSENCAKQIYHGIYADDESTVTDHNCCEMLVAMGKPCHDAIFRATLTLPELIKKDKSKVIAKSSSIWSECVSGPTSAAKSPSESLRLA